MKDAFETAMAIANDPSVDALVRVSRRAEPVAVLYDADKLLVLGRIGRSAFSNRFLIFDERGCPVFSSKVLWGLSSVAYVLAYHGWTNCRVDPVESQAGFRLIKLLAEHAEINCPPAH